MIIQYSQATDADHSMRKSLPNKHGDMPEPRASAAQNKTYNNAIMSNMITTMV